MPVFRIRQREDGFWVPAHPEIEGITVQANDPTTTTEQKRASMWAQIDPIFPGVYSLEWSVAELRADLIARINARTKEVLSSGFVHSGQRYGASGQDRDHYLILAGNQGLFASAVVSNFDDTGETTFSGGGLTAFLNTAFNFVRTTIESGSALKKQARNATTIAALEAIKDTR